METLYHIQRFFDKNQEYYHIGQILEFNKDKPNMLRQEMLSSHGYYLDYEEGDKKHWEPLTHLFNKDLSVISKEQLRYLMNTLDDYIHNTGLFKRETILEEIRREKYNDRPSRYGCMWLTDEECLDSWIKLLYADAGYYNIFEMELDGNIFCSTDELLPDSYTNTSVMYKSAEEYWNPTEEELRNSIKREYLFEGIAKVKKKIK